jgi:hypothetical protein
MRAVVAIRMLLSEKKKRATIIFTRMRKAARREEN